MSNNELVKKNENYQNSVERVTYKMVHITPQIAKDYLKSNLVNRPINNGTVKRYATDLKNRNWTYNGEGNVVFDWDGNLRNGQHRLMAVVSTGIPMDCIVVNDVDPKSFDTMDSGHKRNPADILHIHGVKWAAQIAGMVKKYLSLKHGYKAVIGAEGNTNLTAIGKYGNMNYQTWLTYKETPDTFDKVGEMYRNIDKTRKTLRNKTGMTPGDIGGISVYLHLEKGYPMEKIRAFWEEFFEIDNSVEYTHKYISYLCNLLRDNYDANSRFTPRVRQAYLAKAWNLFVKDDVKTKKINVTEEEAKASIPFE